MPKKAFAPVAMMSKSVAQVGSLSSFEADLSSDATLNKCFSRQHMQLCNRCVLASQLSAGNYNPTQRLSNQALMCECDPCHSRTNAWTNIIKRKKHSYCQTCTRKRMRDASPAAKSQRAHEHITENKWKKTPDGFPSRKIKCFINFGCDSQKTIYLEQHPRGKRSY